MVGKFLKSEHYQFMVFLERNLCGLQWDKENMQIFYI